MSALLPALLAGGAVVVATSPRGAQVRLGALPGLARGGRLSRVSSGAKHTSGPVAAPPSAPGAWPGVPGSRAAVLAVGVVAGLLGGVGLALFAVGMLLAGRRLLDIRRRAGAAQLERRRGVEACAALAAELRAGSSPADALEVAAAVAAGPAGTALRAATATARLGGDVPAALAQGAAGSAIPEALAGLAACWSVCSRAGSGLAAGVERLADGLRAREQQQQAVAAALAGPRASAGLLAVLPVVGVALAAGLGARPEHVLLHTPLGLGCLATGIGLDLLGLWWTRRLVDRAGRAAA